MKNLQKIGGLAALYEAFAYVLGIVFYLVILGICLAIAG